MALTRIQSDVLKALAGQRNPDSYDAGGAPVNRDTVRLSTGIDIFHGRAESVAVAVPAGVEALGRAGFRVNWIRSEDLIRTAEIRRDDEITRLEWVVDSDFRFFPVIPDEVFGFVLDPVDLATNKVMAAAGRRALRDILDLITIHERILALVAVIWAAVEKAPGFTPEGLIAEIRRNWHYPRIEWSEIETLTPIDPVVTHAKLRGYVDEAETFVMKMPTEAAGLLFLLDGKVVQPGPDHLERYQTHAGRRRGHWPRSPEIESAMLEHYTSGPSTA